MKRYLILALFYLFALPSIGQTVKVTTLRNAINLPKNSPERLKAILNFLEEYDSMPEDTLWFYALKAKDLAIEQKDGQAYSLASLAQARAYIRWGNMDSARAIVEHELRKYNPENPSLRKVYFELAQNHFSIYGNNSNYKEGMTYLYDVMRKAELYKDSLVVANCMNTLAAWNYDMDFLRESRTWDYKALAYTNPKDPRFNDVLIGIYNTIGDNYRWIKNIDSATYFISKAIELTKKTQKLTWLSYGLERMCSIYILKKDYAKAENSILEAIRIMQSVKGKHIPQELRMVEASVYEHWGKLDRAIEILKLGLKLDTTTKTFSPHASKLASSTDLAVVFYEQELAKCYRLKGDQKMYATELEKIIDRKDAFYKANSANAIAELETKYEVQKKEATIARQKLNLTKAGYFFWGSILFSFLSGIIIWLLFKEYRRKQFVKIKALQEEEKRLALQAVAEAEESERKRIAADLHDNLGAQLSYIKRNVNYIIDKPPGFNHVDEKKYLGYVKDIAQNAMIDLRETIWVLHKDEVSIQEFADKLKSYLRQQLLDKDTIRLEFQENISRMWMLSSGEVMHLFRIVQEVVSNSIKHSGGDYISVYLESNETGSYELRIKDNGKGFIVNQHYEGHFGMENIQKRASEIHSQIQITSAPGHGTQVLIKKGKNSPFALFSDSEATSTFIQ